MKYPRTAFLLLFFIVGHSAFAGQEAPITPPTHTPSTKTKETQMTIHFNDPIKEALWARVRAMNDAWTKGNPDDLTQFFHPKMIAVTPTERQRLDGQSACVAGWKGFATAAQIHHWKEIDPVIHLYGNSAVVAYDFDMSFDMGGKTHHLGGRDLFFFVHENGKWLAVADQFSPYPQ